MSENKTYRELLVSDSKESKEDHDFVFSKHLNTEKEWENALKEAQIYGWYHLIDFHAVTALQDELTETKRISDKLRDQRNKAENELKNSVSLDVHKNKMDALVKDNERLDRGLKQQCELHAIGMERELKLVKELKRKDERITSLQGLYETAFKEAAMAESELKAVKAEYDNLLAVSAEDRNKLGMYMVRDEDRLKALARANQRLTERNLQVQNLYKIIKQVNESQGTDYIETLVILENSLKNECEAIGKESP